MSLSRSDQAMLKKIKELRAKEESGQDVSAERFQAVLGLAIDIENANSVQNHSIPSRLKEKERLKRASTLGETCFPHINQLFVKGNEDLYAKEKQEQHLINTIQNFFRKI